jgi:mRNA interferase RelE/StbE
VYRLEVKRTAQRALGRLTQGAPADVERIEKAIDGLALNPHPQGAVKILARPPVWRVRVGAYRIVYAVFDVERLVVVGKVERSNERTYEDIPELLR